MQANAIALAIGDLIDGPHLTGQFHPRRQQLAAAGERFAFARQVEDLAVAGSHPQSLRLRRGSPDPLRGNARGLGHPFA